MQRDVVGRADAARRVALREFGFAHLVVQSDRGRPLDTDREYRMSDDTVGTPRVEITGQVILERRRVGHRPARIDLGRGGAAPCSNPPRFQWHRIVFHTSAGARPPPPASPPPYPFRAAP